MEQLTLEELIDRKLKDMGVPTDFDSLNKFINNDESSAKFINYFLNDDGFDVDNTDIGKIVKTRARHSSLTFLIGLVISDFGNLFNEFTSINSIKNEFSNLNYWLVTSLYHDKGYFSEHLKNVSVDYDEFTYNLFNDSIKDIGMLNDYEINHPKVLAYSYKEIKAYDQYAREYHKRNIENGRIDFERVDHGILGGVLTYNDLIRKNISKKISTNSIYFIKACCLTIAQHNIFKSSDKNNDIYYPKELKKLLSTSKFKITNKYPLLMFLDIIDSFECVKRFSKGETYSESVQTLTVLRHIKLIVTKKIIRVDYTDFKFYLIKHKKNKLLDIYNQYKDSLINMNSWIDINVQEISEDIIEFRCNHI